MIPFMGPEFVAYLSERCDSEARERNDHAKQLETPARNRKRSHYFDGGPRKRFNEIIAMFHKRARPHHRLTSKAIA